MKLLFDQNLSPRLCDLLADLFPNSAHLDPLGLGTADDRIVWNYARKNEYTVVTKDSDFSEIIVLLGFPPKVIWIRSGNCSTREIEQILRDNYDAILQLETHEEAGILTLF